VIHGFLDQLAGAARLVRRASSFNLASVSGVRCSSIPVKCSVSWGGPG
jgi:hypothetical protein